MSSTRTSAKLTGQDAWRLWYTDAALKAQSLGIWDYVRPDTETPEPIPHRPQRPTLEEAVRRARDSLYPSSLWETDTILSTETATTAAPPLCRTTRSTTQAAAATAENTAEENPGSEVIIPVATPLTERSLGLSPIDGYASASEAITSWYKILSTNFSMEMTMYNHFRNAFEKLDTWIESTVDEYILSAIRINLVHNTKSDALRTNLVHETLRILYLRYSPEDA